MLDNKIVKMVIEKFSKCATQYRFDKKSNFISYQEFCQEEAMDNLINLGKELERYKKFKKLSNEELAQKVIKWEKGPNISMPDEFYYKKEGIDAKNELIRRDKIEIISLYRKENTCD